MSEQTMEQQADRAAAAGDFASARALLEQATQAGEPSRDLWIKLSAVRKLFGDFEGALAAVDQALALSPLEFSALLHRAMLLESLGDPMAGEEFGNALAQAPPDEETPEALRPAIAQARQRWRTHQANLEQRLLEVLPETLSANERRRVERLISNRSRRTRHFHSEPRDFQYPGLPELDFHDRELFPELHLLEQAAGEIRSEFDALIAAEAAEMVPYIQYPERVPLGQWRDLNHNPKWTAIHLLQNGWRIEDNARHCPSTMDVLSRIPQPQIRNASPNAMFSLLAPRTRIPPHTGAANTRLVCHLPLIVPANCGFRVGESTREWRVGEAFVFDDTIEHEAWNDSDELRVVLIIDLWAPALSQAERDAVAAVIGTAGATVGV
jgi:aspartyl/asparaginyl beta-hydroxylase (cupin superfamily)